jgi:hypothetical protein
VSNEAEQRERAELLARCLDDYPTFCRALIWVIPKGGQRRRLRFKQAQATYDANRSWRDVVLKGRQVGMTTEGVARDVYKFVSQPGQRVVIVVQSITGNPGPSASVGDGSRDARRAPSERRAARPRHR